MNTLQPVHMSVMYVCELRSDAIFKYSLQVNIKTDWDWSVVQN